MTSFRIVRDEGEPDTIAGRSFKTYNEAYVVQERYYGELFCSDKR